MSNLASSSFFHGTEAYHVSLAVMRTAIHLTAKGCMVASYTYRGAAHAAKQAVGAACPAAPLLVWLKSAPLVACPGAPPLRFVPNGDHESGEEQVAQILDARPWKGVGLSCWKRGRFRV